MLLLDYRGTGLSNTLTTETIQRVSTDPQEQADYLAHFRADNIVRDLEAVRKYLTMDAASEKLQKWSLMGQSYGGFVATTYLSFYPEGLREVFVMGGLPPLRGGAEEAYRRIYSMCYPFTVPSSYAT